MLPVSANDTVRFTPKNREKQDNPPVYLLAVPRVKDRPRFHYQLALEGVQNPSDDEIRAATEAAVGALPEGRRAAALDLVARYWDANAAGTIPQKLEEEHQALARELTSLDEALRRLGAERNRYFGLLPIIACQMFLKGVENVDADFRLEGGLVSEQTLADLDAEDVVAAGWHAWGLMVLPRARLKNSASPSRSAASPQPSTADANPSKAAAGNSSARSTRKTPASS